MAFDPKEFEEIKKLLHQKKIKKQVKEERAIQVSHDLITFKNRVQDATKAQAFIQLVAQRTQEKIEKFVGNLVTLAIAAVIPNPPTFEIKFEKRRGSIECDVFLNERGHLYDPMLSAGGAKDLASLGLRLAFWKLRKNRPTFILDEPFRNVSPDLQHKVSDLLKDLTSRLGIQIIMVSHAEEINVSADKTFLVTKDDKGSHVKELQ